jgi:hypothetical protein
MLGASRMPQRQFQGRLARMQKQKGFSNRLDKKALIGNSQLLRD